MDEEAGGSLQFIRTAPDDSTYFRSIVLFGGTTAAYKFALSHAPLDVARLGRTTVTLPELAPHFAQHLLIRPPLS